MKPLKAPISQPNLRHERHERTSKPSKVRGRHRERRERRSKTNVSTNSSNISFVNVVINKRYKLKKEIGKGSFGLVYNGKDIKTIDINSNKSLTIACKLEPFKPTFSPQLYHEFKILRNLAKIDKISTQQNIHNDGNQKKRINNINIKSSKHNKIVGIPEPYYYGKIEDKPYNALVMEALGDSLESLFNKCGRVFSLKCVLMIADQLLERIEYIHSQGYIHRDLKPDNFLIGRSNSLYNRVLYIIDFGLSKPYKSMRTNKHIPFKEGKSLTGTARYASVNTHMGIEQSRRDDLESLGYIFMYFLKGKLPWQGLKAKNRTKKYELIAKTKIHVQPEKLCLGFPKEFVKYIRYCWKLEFTEKPDYKALRTMFRDLFFRQNYHADWKFDWNLLPNKPNYKITNTDNYSSNHNNKRTSNPNIKQSVTKNSISKDYLCDDDENDLDKKLSKFLRPSSSNVNSSRRIIRRVTSNHTNPYITARNSYSGVRYDKKYNLNDNTIDGRRITLDDDDEIDNIINIKNTTNNSYYWTKDNEYYNTEEYKTYNDNHRINLCDSVSECEVEYDKQNSFKSWNNSSQEILINNNFNIKVIKEDEIQSGKKHRIQSSDTSSTYSTHIETEDNKIRKSKKAHSNDNSNNSTKKKRRRDSYLGIFKDNFKNKVDNMISNHEKKFNKKNNKEDLIRVTPVIRHVSKKQKKYAENDTLNNISNIYLNPKSSSHDFSYTYTQEYLNDHEIDVNGNNNSKHNNTIKYENYTKNKKHNSTNINESNPYKMSDSYLRNPMTPSYSMSNTFNFTNNLSTPKQRPVPQYSSHHRKSTNNSYSFSSMNATSFTNNNSSTNNTNTYINNINHQNSHSSMINNQNSCSYINSKSISQISHMYTPTDSKGNINNNINIVSYDPFRKSKSHTTKHSSSLSKKSKHKKRHKNKKKTNLKYNNPSYSNHEYSRNEQLLYS